MRICRLNTRHFWLTPTGRFGVNQVTDGPHAIV